MDDPNFYYGLVAGYCLYWVSTISFFRPEFCNLCKSTKCRGIIDDKCTVDIRDFIDDADDVDGVSDDSSEEESSGESDSGDESSDLEDIVWQLQETTDRRKNI
jgi:hypothetical protein